PPTRRSSDLYNRGRTAPARAPRPSRVRLRSRRRAHPSDWSRLPSLYLRLPLMHDFLLVLKQLLAGDFAATRVVCRYGSVFTSGAMARDDNGNRVGMDCSRDSARRFWLTNRFGDLLISAGFTIRNLAQFFPHAKLEAGRADVQR